MIDLGRKNDNGISAQPESGNKNKKMYPYFSITGIDVGLSENDVGKTITAKVSLKINSLSSRVNTTQESGAKKVTDCAFDVLSIEFDKKTLDDGKPKANWSTQKILEYRKKNAK